MKIIPFPHQEKAIDTIFNWFPLNTDPNTHPIVKIATGGGKSVVIAEFIRRVITQYSDQRILMVTSSKELVSQNFEKLKAIFPECDAGLYCAGLGKKQPNKKVVFGTIGSLHNKVMQLGKFNLCIIDECHTVNTKKDVGIYRKMIADFKKINPRFRVIGLTATDFRGNGVLLTEGETALFSETIVDISIRYLLDRGFLAPLVTSKTNLKIDSSEINVNKATGDYVVSELAKSVDKEEITNSVVSEIIERGQGRKSWMIFGVDIQHCEHLHDALKARGLIGNYVTGKTPVAQRESFISNFRRGAFTYLVSCETLTTGFDVQQVDLIALVRPTRSPVLFVQIAGRGLRTHPEKIDCLFLDFTDTTETLGAIDQIKGRKEVIKKKESYGQALKKCPSCGAINQPTARFCVCGFEFVIEHSININAQSSDAPILSTGVNPNVIDVSDIWTHRIHYKEGSPDTLRVSYIPVGAGNLSKIPAEYICFDHQGYARRKAENWWLKLGGLLPIPASTQEAYARFSELKRPAQLIIQKNGKYTEIQGHVTNNSNATQLPNTNAKKGADYFSQAVFGTT